MLGHSKYRGTFGRCEQGSLTVEAMLTLPVLLLALFLCVALVYSVHGAFVLDQALAAACRDLAEGAYLLQQATGLGLDAAQDYLQAGKWLEGLEETAAGDAALWGDLTRQIAGKIWAVNCLNQYLEQDTALAGAYKWRLIRLPVNGGGEQETGAAGMPPGLNPEPDRTAAEDLDADDIVLTLVFTPAKLNALTALLPETWQLTISKRQRAWLTGRSLSPQRGLEQPAAGDGKGALVYITRWGVKYHTESCRHLAKSKIPAYLNELSTAYGACSLCKPPQRT